LCIALAACAGQPSTAAPAAEDPDARVARFLAERRGSWRAANVPYEDGKVLHDVVVERGFKSILEIGTSTGHSTVWLAWAARKTGGEVITIEIDRGRYEQAIANVRAAGLMDHVTFHIANAHQLVPKLPGPFDFVFSDADKDWYVNYFNDVDPRIKPGGCIAAHNALNGFAGVDRYIEHVKKRADYETRILETSPSGFALSCKRRVPSPVSDDP
jgi:predicted O-methyltransferase YrrM